MRKFVFTIAFFFSGILFAPGNPIYCDDCWAYGPDGTMVNWTFMGGAGDCWNSFHTNNMYPWSTAYVYQDGVLIDVISYNNSSNVACANYI